MELLSAQLRRITGQVSESIGQENRNGMNSSRFGPTNRLFNQLISNLAQSFENEYYYLQVLHLSESSLLELTCLLLNI